MADITWSSFVLPFTCSDIISTQATRVLLIHFLTHFSLSSIHTTPHTVISSVPKWSAKHLHHQGVYLSVCTVRLRPGECSRHSDSLSFGLFRVWTPRRDQEKIFFLEPFANRPEAYCTYLKWVLMFFPRVKVGGEWRWTHSHLIHRRRQNITLHSLSLSHTHSAPSCHFIGKKLPFAQLSSEAWKHMEETFLALALNVPMRPFSRQCHLIPMERWPVVQWIGEPAKTLDRRDNILPLSRIEPRFLGQYSTSQYTVWANLWAVCIKLEHSILMIQNFKDTSEEAIFDTCYRLCVEVCGCILYRAPPGIADTFER
jgi:hypothetical protein